MIKIVLIVLGLGLYHRCYPVELPGCFVGLEFAVDKRFFFQKELPKDGDWIEVHYTKQTRQYKDSRNGVNSDFFRLYLPGTARDSKCGYRATLRVEFRVIGKPDTINQIRMIWLKKNTYAVVFRAYE
jgi:hypothetical protein